MDQFTIRNLELIHPQQDGGISLIHVVDHTVTAMGSRLLKKWVVFPLMQAEEIRRRHDSVEVLSGNTGMLGDLREALGEIADLERLIGKVATARINPREFLQLRNSLKQIPQIRELLLENDDAECKAIAENLHTSERLVDQITSNLKDEVPLLTNQGNMMRDGINEELDELRKIAFSGKDYLVQIQQREAERTGITSLKIAYNKVFGYYLEVSNAHKDKVPEEWIRKQTLVNAERYITEELKIYEEKILHAEEKLVVIEQHLYSELVSFAGDFCERIQETAREIGRLDCLQSFAKLAVSNNYVRPEINDGLALDIKQGRHPVIEQQMPAGEKYIPNDVFLDSNDAQVMVITGPNMAGKSALLRQTALIILLAQMGSFVPAKTASLGITDKVFTRVGASDNLAKGESTFMVEMTETASILNNMSSRSLILMDEIGRGTSTYDGVSIAWSILEYLHNHYDHRPKTLFATHYHELNQLADDFPRIRNFNVSVKQAGDKILFMRTLKPGGSQHSFGIHVAQLAGMPNKVVIRANEIMHFLEKDHRKDLLENKMAEIPRENYQMSLFEADPRFAKVEEMLSQLDINTISPVEALLKLNEIQTILKNKE
jgi:DNA mismatch repair protein MutS